MCYYVLVGAETDALRLQEALSADGLFDTDQGPAEAALARFPESDNVVCVTLDGCSCALLETPVTGKVWSQHRRQRDAFYAALSRATLRFGSIRLLVMGRDGSADLASTRREGTIALREFLSTRRSHAQELLRVVA